MLVVEDGSAKGSHTVRSARQMVLDTVPAPPGDVNDKLNPCTLVKFHAQDIFRRCVIAFNHGGRSLSRGANPITMYSDMNFPEVPR